MKERHSVVRLGLEVKVKSIAKGFILPNFLVGLFLDLASEFLVMMKANDFLS